MKRIFNPYVILSAALLLPAFSMNAGEPGGCDSLIHYPWGQEKTFETATGTIHQVSSADLGRRAIGDLRNRFTGMVPGLEVTESGSGFFSSASGNFTAYNLGATANNFFLKGFSTLNVIVDDIPIPYNQLLLEPDQIESITFLSDILDKVKAGPVASYTAAYIKTKRGGYDTPLRISASVESGINMIDRLPGWVNGVDYAKLNNLSRSAAGLIPLYTDADIEAFALGNANDPVNPCVDYEQLMLNKAFPTTSFALTATAGSRNIKYHVALNGLNSGDILKSGCNDYNRLNLSANLTTRIGRWIEASAGFNGLLGFRRHSSGVNWYHYRFVPEVAFPLILGTVSAENAEDDLSGQAGRTIYGVSKTFGTNYYAAMLEGGYRTLRTRSGYFNANVNVDLGWLLRGLYAKTMIASGSFIATNMGKSNDYIAYYWEPGSTLEISDHKGVRQTSRDNTTNITSQTLAFYERLGYDRSLGGSSVKAALSYYQSSAVQSGDTYHQRLQYFEGDAAWSYKDRYNVEVAAQYSGSSRYKKGHRFGFFPSAGASWVASNEPFLKGSNTLTKLRLHAQVGEAGTADLFGSPYLYQALYTTSAGTTYGPASQSGPQWFGNNTRKSQYTTMSRLDNEGLTWARIFQADLGLNLELFHCLTLDVDLYRWRRYGIISDVLGNLPAVFGITATVYDNYEARVAKGVDVALGFKKTFGGVDVGVMVSGGLASQIYDKLVTDNYLYEYQKLTGSSVYAVRGFECIGKYHNQEEIDALPSYVDKSALRVGDLKYKDQNNDDKIDSNDRVVIGSSRPLVPYSVNLSLGWKGIDFLIVGTGRIGGQINLGSSTYFTGGTGNGNYSQFILENLGGEFPRLNYYAIDNNTVTSSFWLRDADWFKIQALDLGYTLPVRKRWLSSVRFDLKGTNLLTFTKIKYVDPESMDAGLSDYPMFRTVTVGARLNF